MDWLRLIVETLLYFLAAKLLARRDDEPGLLRVFITVLLLALVSGGIHNFTGNFWVGSFGVLILGFIILWIGLGIGLIRTVLAILIVYVVRLVLIRTFFEEPTLPTTLT